MNSVPESQTEESLKDPKFRILIVNNKTEGYVVNKGENTVETPVLEVKKQGRPKKKLNSKKVHTNLLDCN